MFADILLSIITVSLLGNFCLNIFEYFRRSKSNKHSQKSIETLVRNMAIISERHDRNENEAIDMIRKLQNEISPDDIFPGENEKG